MIRRWGKQTALFTGPSVWNDDSATSRWVTLQQRRQCWPHRHSHIVIPTSYWLRTLARWTGMDFEMKHAADTQTSPTMNSERFPLWRTVKDKRIFNQMQCSMTLHILLHHVFFFLELLLLSSRSWRIDSIMLWPTPAASYYSDNLLKMYWHHWFW